MGDTETIAAWTPSRLSLSSRTEPTGTKAPARMAGLARAAVGIGLAIGSIGSIGRTIGTVGLTMGLSIGLLAACGVEPEPAPPATGPSSDHTTEPEDTDLKDTDPQDTDPPLTEGPMDLERTRIELRVLDALDEDPHLMGAAYMPEDERVVVTIFVEEGEVLSEDDLRALEEKAEAVTDGIDVVIELSDEGPPVADVETG
jgi:hypothetical protein